MKICFKPIVIMMSSFLDHDVVDGCGSKTGQGHEDIPLERITSLSVISRRETVRKGITRKVPMRKALMCKALKTGKVDSVVHFRLVA